MDDIFIVGLPKVLRSRVEGSIVRSGAKVRSILADLGKEGRLRLVPHPGQALHDFRAFLDERTDWQDIHIVVLPYAPLPEDLMAEMSDFEAYFGCVSVIEAGKGGWPQAPKGRPDGGCLDAIFAQLRDTLFPVVATLPSEHFAGLAAACDQIVLTTGALSSCDEVDPHRRGFLIDGANALHEYVMNPGGVGRVDEFFGARGLKFAQSGGMTVTLEVYRNGKIAYTESCQTHLKKGDATTPQSAARLYFHVFRLDEIQRVAILYAGPHPEGDCTRTCRLD